PRLALDQGAVRALVLELVHGEPGDVVLAVALDRVAVAVLPAGGESAEAAALARDRRVLGAGGVLLHRDPQVAGVVHRVGDRARVLRLHLGDTGTGDVHGADDLAARGRGLLGRRRRGQQAEGDTGHGQADQGS